MALAICTGALLLGILAERLRRRNVRTQTVLAAVGLLFIAAAYQAAFTIILRLQIVAWSWYFGSELVTGQRSRQRARS